MRTPPSITLGACAAALFMLASPIELASDEPGAGHGEHDEIRLQRLAIGKTYSVTHLMAAPLVVHNTHGETLQVHLEVGIPPHHELEQGAMPLPSRAWVQLEHERFALPAGAARDTDVRVTVPYDPDLAGNTYQVDIRLRMVDACGRTRESGRIHRLVFTVEMDYRDDTEARFTAQPRTPRRPRS